MSAGVGPTEQQIKRRERASTALNLLKSEETRHILRQAEDRALKAMRAAKTPDEAWEARALLMGHDELIGLLFLISQDVKNVDREIGQEEARAAGAAAQARRAEDHILYLERAQRAREEADKAV